MPCEPRFEPVSDTHLACVCCGLTIHRDVPDPGRIGHPCLAAPRPAQAVVPPQGGKCCGGKGRGTRDEGQGAVAPPSRPLAPSPLPPAPSAEPELPGLLTMAGNLAGTLARSAVAAAAGGKVFLSAEQAAARVAMCETCDRFRARDRRCAACGCYVDEAAKYAEKDCPLRKWPGERPLRILAKLQAGLGDAVQFTIVLRHLRHYYPDAEIDVLTNARHVGLYAGQCARAAGDRRHLRPAAEYDLAVGERWGEPHVLFPDCPSSNAVICLRSQYGLEPIPELCRYVIHRSAENEAAAESLLHRMLGAPGPGGKWNVVLLHLAGVSHQEKKNLTPEVARAAIRAVRAAGAEPIVLECGGQLRGVATEENCRVLLKRTTADPRTLAALMARVRLVVGIDSGPGHVVGATDTPALIVWTGHHPLHYYGLSPNVTHLVPEDHPRLLQGTNPAALEWFAAHYAHRTYQSLEDDLPATIEETLTGRQVLRPRDRVALWLGKPARVLLTTRHGLGDSVQLSVVLRHLAFYCPQWEITLLVLEGKHTAYRGQVHEVIAAPSPERRQQLWDDFHASGTYDLALDLAWHECRESYADSPSTKAEKCLREILSLEPIWHLCRGYRLEIGDEARAWAAEWLARAAGDRPRRPDGRYAVGLVHYQGDSSRDKKDLSDAEARWLLEALAADWDLAPVLVDFDGRSPLCGASAAAIAAGRQFAHTRDVPKDAERIAALIDQAAVLVAIDSGPLHVAAATRTPTVAVWREYHPIHYLCPADNVVNLVPPDHVRLIRGDAQRGLAHFAAHYQYRVWQSFLVDAHALIGDLLDTAGWSREREHWIRQATALQDLTIVRDVYEQDCYRLVDVPPAHETVVDVGACLGSFSLLAHRRNPLAKILAVEACPENLPALRRNVGGFATVLHAACTYEPDVALLNAVYPGCASTGGSKVRPRAQVQAYAQGPQRQPGVVLPGSAADPDDCKREYWADDRPLETITLEEICARYALDRIDVLKLDCEGSEFSILENCDLSRIRRIVGEWHGRERFFELVRRRFGGWRFEILRDGEPGLFRLTCPELAR